MGFGLEVTDCQPLSAQRKERNCLVVFLAQIVVDKAPDSALVMSSYQSGRQPLSELKAGSRGQEARLETCRTQQGGDGDSLEGIHSVTSGMLGTKILDLDPSRSESLVMKDKR